MDTQPPLSAIVRTGDTYYRLTGDLPEPPIGLEAVVVVAMLRAWADMIEGYQP